jgi:hypothetical protein
MDSSKDNASSQELISHHYSKRFKTHQGNSIIIFSLCSTFLFIYFFIIVTEFVLIFVGHHASSSIGSSVSFLNTTSNEQYNVSSNPGEFC